MDVFYVRTVAVNGVYQYVPAKYLQLSDGSYVTDNNGTNPAEVQGTLYRIDSTRYFSRSYR